MKKVYLLLSRTGTVPSRVIHKATGGTFTHTSISLTPATDRFYSYARRRIHNPLRAGLFIENIHTGVFAMYPDCHCSLFSLDVSDEAFEKMQRCVKHFLNNYKRAKYNFLGVVPLRLGIRFPRKYRLTCSQFVAVVLASSGEVSLPKDPYRMLPNDFPKLAGLKKLYDGPLKDCAIPKTCNAENTVE